ncbi:MAG TPA: beta-ketoacyl-ACP synthase III [Candidatus Limnocylindrales bacterium]|nr:beta-ketoacyl-ACP synthase III [Candidatus Limnocylindrales bacterium]
MTLPQRSHILGAGFEVPQTVVTNDELSSVLDTSDEWIQQRSGIKERRYVDDDQGSVPLAERASRRAIEMAGITPADIDLILCGTLSPDVDFPGNSSWLQQRLGLEGVLAFDVRNQCSGFLYMLSIADQYVRTGGARHVLIVGSEVHSSGIEYADRSRHVTVLFGDGAGAVVVGPAPDAERGLLTINLHAEGKYAEKLCLLGPGSLRKPRIPAGWSPADIYGWPQMDGKLVFRHAVTRMTEAIEEALADIGARKEDIAMLVPHQANLRINQLVAMGLGIGDDRMGNNIDRYGNTTAATIPILLAETWAAGRIKRGDLVCLAAFGSGFTWGAALLRW